MTFTNCYNDYAELDGAAYNSWFAAGGIGRNLPGTVTCLIET